MANIYLALGKEKNAKKAWKRALRLVKKKGFFLLAEDSLPYQGLIQLGLNQGHDVGGLLNEALSLFPTNLQLQCLHGKILMHKERFEEAIQVFGHMLLSVKTDTYDHTISYDTRLFSEIPLSELATCCFKLGRYSDSQHYFELAAKCAPDNLEYRVKQELCGLLARPTQSVMT